MREELVAFTVGILGGLLLVAVMALGWWLAGLLPAARRRRAEIVRMRAEMAMNEELLTEVRAARDIALHRRDEARRELASEQVRVMAEEISSAAMVADMRRMAGEFRENTDKRIAEIEAEIAARTPNDRVM